MLAVIEPMVRFILLATYASFLNIAAAQVTSRPATWAHSHLAHRL